MIKIWSVFSLKPSCYQRRCPVFTIVVQVCPTCVFGGKWLHLPLMALNSSQDFCGVHCDILHKSGDVIVWIWSNMEALHHIFSVETPDPLRWRQSALNLATVAARTRGFTWTLRGAAWYPLPEVLGNGSMEVPHGGAGGHGDHPGVVDGLVSSQPGSWVQKEQAPNKVFGEVGHWGPRLRNRIKENMTN